MKNILENTNTYSDNTFFKIGKGTLVSLGFTLILLFLLAVIVTYSNIQEAVIPTVIIIITAISILLGSSMATAKTGKNGMATGAMVRTMLCVNSIFTIYSFEIFLYA